METLSKFITPLECLLNQIKDNANLVNVCNAINEGLKESYQIGKSVQITCISSEEFNYVQSYLLKEIYKRYGWKLNLSGKVKLNENTQYTFSIIENY